MRGYSKFKIYSNILLLNNLLNKSSKKIISVRTLGLPIDESYIGRKVKLYSGQNYNILTVNKFMVGFKFGEFVFSRKRLKHKKKK